MLSAEGCEVVVPQAQECCGALAEHAGEEADAMAAARRLIDAFERADVDTIVVNAAGCGSAMKRYGHLLRNDAGYAERARAFAAKCRDISEVLAELEPRAPRGAVPLRAAYHDACHLQHAQGVRAQPRRLLQQIPASRCARLPNPRSAAGLPASTTCSSRMPQRSFAIGKCSNILKTDAEVIVSGNPGCLLQIAAGLEAAGGRCA